MYLIIHNSFNNQLFPDYHNLSNFRSQKSQNIIFYTIKLCTVQVCMKLFTYEYSATHAQVWDSGNAATHHKHIIIY